MFPLYRISLKLLSKQKFPTAVSPRSPRDKKGQGTCCHCGVMGSTAVSTTMTWQTTEPSVVDAPQHSHDPLAMQESDLSTPIIG